MCTTLLYEWIWLNQHEHEESNQFHLGRKTAFLHVIWNSRGLNSNWDMTFRDSLHGHHLYKVWERLLLIWSRFGRFFYLSRRPSLFGVLLDFGFLRLLWAATSSCFVVRILFRFGVLCLLFPDFPVAIHVTASGIRVICNSYWKNAP